MHDGNLYEYAIVRYVPRIEREEFINVGLAMMCKRKRWIRLEIKLSEDRLAAFSPLHTTETLRNQLNAFRMIADGDSAAGPVAGYPVEERFRWLTAAKSACIQTSRPHPG
ncbi:MAG: DUF3037 domain-containing protein, partial [Paramuribaculum sp.]|nr:DUF3037 domain-containing protein [Paramuribaculum sp.]